MQTRDLLLFFIAFSFGVLLPIFGKVQVGPAALCAAGLGLFLFIFACLRRQGFLKRKYFSQTLLCIIALLFFMLGFARVEFLALGKREAVFASYIDMKVSIEGMITDEPDERELNTRFPVLVSSFDKVKLEKPVTVLVSTDPMTHVLYGDSISATGTLREPKAFTTDQGTIFDYKSYLLKDGVSFLLPQAKVSVLSHGNGSKIRAFLFNIKAKIVEGFDRSLPVPENALLGGLVLGAKSQIPNDLRNDFVRTGTIHIIALSGYNVTIVALFFMKIFRVVMSEALALYIGIFAIVLFAIMTGGGATVVRASVMSIIALLARKSGRPFDAGRALIIACFGMILWNPLVLPYDISFQLSCLATLGLIYVTPITARWFKFVPARFGFRELISATVATNISVLPFILYKMGILSLITLPANLLILPIIPLTMFFGFAGGILSLFSPVVAYSFTFFSHILLSYEINIIHSLSQIPFAAVTINNIPLLAVCVVYVLLIWWVYRNVMNSQVPPS